MELGDVPGERRPYDSAGGLESSRVALDLVSIAYAHTALLQSIRI
jgi:hypothetical protein